MKHHVTKMNKKRDLFTRLKEALIRFFSEKKKTRERPAKKKGKQPAKRHVKHAKKRKAGKKPPKKDSFFGEQYKKRPEDVPMPAPWSKVTKYKKVKKDNYFNYY